MEFNSLDILTVNIDEYDEAQGVSVMSFVKDPAVKTEFLALEKEHQMKFSLNDDKQIVTGVALRANYPIYRRLSDGREVMVKFTPEAIEKIAMKFMKESRGSNVNLNHRDDVDDVYLFESFLLSQMHTTKYPGLSDIEMGSWMVSYKVDNPDVWNKIKNGEIKGFSVEVLGALKDEDSDNQAFYKEIYDLIKQLN